MPNVESNAQEVMLRWRSGVKRKARRVISALEQLGDRLEKIAARRFVERRLLDGWEIRQAYFKSWGTYDYLDAHWRPIQVGDPWGGPEITAFFRCPVQIPPAWSGRPVLLRFYVGGDSLLSLDGRPFHGLDPFRDEILLAPAAQAGQRLQLEVESYVNWHSDESDHKIFHLAELAVPDPFVWQAYWDLNAVYKVLLSPDLPADQLDFLQNHLERALAGVYPQHQSDRDFQQALRSAQEHIKTAVYRPGRSLAGTMTMVGHSHLDLVFMWPYREFQRKVGRTHATMLRLLEQYPEFRFSQSQAALYQEMKANYPELYAQVKQRVAERRWEPLGAFWVEPDCNLISGESLVRQVLAGQQFWNAEFGLRSRICWQPDVFGMGAALPQILRRSGVDYVMTNKMFVWNDTNPWRQNTFWWEGLDGTRILTVIPPGHFIGTVDPDQVLAQWKDYSDRETIGNSLYCYGWGDGGGGVDVEMLELARRYVDFPSLPRMSPALASDYFTQIEPRAVSADLPVWRGDLYLETHRGTFTTKARLKKLNRCAEFLYRRAEMLATWAWVETGEYPQEALLEGWRRLLTTQFHDSLPGTHVHEAYVELLAEFEQIFQTGREIAARAANRIACRDQAEQLSLFNSLAHPRRGVEKIPLSLADGRSLLDPNGAVIQVQRVHDLDGSTAVLAELPELDPISFGSLRISSRPARACGSSLQCAAEGLENEFLLARFDRRGELTSLFDKRAGRQILLPGQPGNRIQMYEDIPGKYDAWDIVGNYRRHEIPLGDEAQLTVDENGPLRVSLRLERKFGNSRLVQRISLRKGDPLLYFETLVHWQERQKLLKVGFPLDLHSLSAACDVAFGNLELPTHRNTSFERARFEVPAHLWVDLSEAGYGVALVNDCKYGHEVDGSTIRLTLLKGSIYPDPLADLEEHHFTYALYPHAGGWREAAVIQRALNLNESLAVFEGRQSHTSGSWVACDADNLTLEAFKRAEDGNGLVLRLVERHNRRTSARLTFAHPLAEAWLCNLLEEQETQLACLDGSVQLSLRPFEIVTLRVTLKLDESGRSGEASVKVPGG